MAAQNQNQTKCPTRHTKNFVMDGVLPIMVLNEGENNRMIDILLILAFYSLTLLVATPVLEHNGQVQNHNSPGIFHQGVSYYSCLSYHCWILLFATPLRIS
jgi:hypothetical protein